MSVKDDITEPITFDEVDRARDRFILKDRYDEDEMMEELMNMDGLWNTSLLFDDYKGPGLKGFIKYALCRAVIGVMVDHVGKQMIFNGSLTNCMEQLHCMATENERLREEIVVLKERIDRLEKN